MTDIDHLPPAGRWAGDAGAVTARCRCGRVCAECRGDPVRISVCHCHACQLRTGSAFAAQIRFPEDRVHLTGERRSWTRVADSGARVSYEFCPNCGSTIAYANDAYPGAIAIPMGAFAGIELPRPWVSVYEERKAGWVDIAGEGIEHHD
jgi:hypothetical protein